MAKKAEDSSKEPAGPGGGVETGWEELRQQLERFRLVLEADYNYQEQLLAGATQYQKELREIAQECAATELAALDTAVADTRKAPSAEGVNAVRQAWRIRALDIRQDASRRLMEAGARLADHQRRAWLDHWEARAELHRGLMDFPRF